MSRAGRNEGEARALEDGRRAGHHHCRVEGRAKKSAAETWELEVAESSTQVGEALRHGVRPSVSVLC